MSIETRVVAGGMGVREFCSREWRKFVELSRRGPIYRFFAWLLTRLTHLVAYCLRTCCCNSCLRLPSTPVDIRRKKITARRPLLAQSQPARSAAATRHPPSTMPASLRSHTVWLGSRLASASPITLSCSCLVSADQLGEAALEPGAADLLGVGHIRAPGQCDTDTDTYTDTYRTGIRTTCIQWR